MIPHLVSYSHTVVDSNGDKHEVGLHGYVEEGESYQDAIAKVSVLVQEQSQQFVVNYDELIQNVEQEINQTDEEITGRLESIGSFTQFAEANGLDFKPPSFPFVPIQSTEEVILNEERTETGEIAGTPSTTEPTS